MWYEGYIQLQPLLYEARSPLFVFVLLDSIAWIVRGGD